LSLPSGNTISGTGTLLFQGTGTQTITSSGTITVATIQFADGTDIVLGANLTTGTSVLIAGAGSTGFDFSSAGYNIDTGSFYLLGNFSVASVWDLSGSTITVRTSLADVVFTGADYSMYVSGNNVTVDAAGTTINSVDADGGVALFGSTNTSSGSVVNISGGSTTGLGNIAGVFSTLNISVAGTYTIGNGGVPLELDTLFSVVPNTVLTYAYSIGGTTIALASVSVWDADGTSGNLVVFNSDTPGQQGGITIPSGTLNANFISLTDNNAYGGATFNALSSTDGGGNTGWNFPPPTTNTVLTISAASTFSAAGRRILAGTATFNSSTSLSAVGRARISRVATFSSQASFSGVGRSTVSRAYTISSSVTFNAGGAKKVASTLNIVGIATFVARGNMRVPGVATFSPDTNLNFVANTGTAIATFSPHAAFSAVGRAMVVSSYTVTSGTSFVAVGRSTARGAYSMLPKFTYSPIGRAIARAIYTMASQGVLTPIGRSSALAIYSINSHANWTVTGRALIPSVGTFLANALYVPRGASNAQVIYDMMARNQLQAVGAAAADSTYDIEADSNLALDGRAIHNVFYDIAINTLFIVDGTGIQFVVANFLPQTELEAVGQSEAAGGFEMNPAATLAAEGVTFAFAVANWSPSATFNAVGRRIVPVPPGHSFGGPNIISSLTAANIRTRI